MLLKLSNAFTLSLRNIISRAANNDGIPKHIELNSKEAFGLLREICANTNIRSHYTYDEGPADFGLRFRLNEKIDQDGLNEIANKWHKREIGILYNDVPLFIVVPKVKKQVNNKYRRVLKQTR